MKIQRSSIEEQILVAIFPEEIWWKILQNVDNQHKYSVFNACLLYRRLLSPSRQHFMFPDVWPLLIATGNIQKATDERKITLCLRLVCKDWCVGVNNYYENLSSSFDNWVLESKITCRIPPFVHCTALNLDISWITSPIDNFLENVGRLTPNRFSMFRRSVKLKVFLDLERASKLRLFLGAYGVHIWNLDLSLIGTMFSCVHLYSEFREWLVLLPNLKSFKFTTFSRMEPRSFEKLSELFECKPLPCLKQLQAVIFDAVPVSICTHFFKTNNKLEYINYADFPLIVNQIEFPNLQSLVVKISSEKDFASLETLKDPAWQLKEVSLSFPGVFIDWSRVFSFLEKFKNSLQIASVSLPLAFGQDNLISLLSPHNLTLNLPKMKRLELHLWNICGIDFILPMRDSLEQLTYVTYASSDDGCMKNSQIVRITKELRDAQKIRFNWLGTSCLEVFDCGIWELLPNLKKVCVQRRMEYETESRMFYRG